MSRFHPTYRRLDRPATPVETLHRARRLGLDAGLRFVYTGNLHAGGREENTHCPGCDALLIARHGYSVRIGALDAAGRCGECGEAIPGVWSAPRKESP